MKGTTKSENKLTAGSPHPQGATVVGGGVNFALFSAHATKVWLCLFDENDDALAELEIPYKTGDVWHCHVKNLCAGQRYAFRAHGPYQPKQGHLFNRSKLLIDPYAKRLSGELTWDDSLYGYALMGDSGEARDVIDSQDYVPRSIVVDDSFAWSDDDRPDYSLKDSIIYEIHVKGFTQNFSAIPSQFRGTYLGLAQPAVIDYLKQLGVTTIELLPCHSFTDERWLVERELTNYWGYNSIGFFSPSVRYAVLEPVSEFKTMVNALHNAGIEVVIDVVYNHTAEGNGYGPTLSFRGIDNAVYYRLNSDDKRIYENYSGCGNTINTEHPQVMKLLADSMRYWVEEMHIDGFRFDLAPALGRYRTDFDPYGTFFNIINQDPVLSQVKMIAEPWDLGPGGYQVGNFPSGWSEWNDKYRDVIRSYWRGEGGVIGQLAERFAGSSDLYRARGKNPSASVNFIAAHDGFCLYDVVAYHQKHNEANKENNRDGHNHNISWNCGHEGPSTDPEVLALRLRQRKNMLATLLLSQGVPMLLGGDEFGRSQQGNNNAYCQDNDISWLDWSLLEKERDLFEFVSRVITLRKEHPVFRRGHFLDGTMSEGAKYKDVTWFHANGREMTVADWHQWCERAIGILLAGDSLPDIDNNGQIVTDDNFLMLLNASDHDISFTLPKPHHETGEWQVIFDTAKPEKDGQGECYSSDSDYPMEKFSCVLMIELD
jgi:glycogen operon protein